MAPIKFEENIREKLQERELQPSKDAWNKLAATLENEPDKKTNRMMWIGVAASLGGILLVVSFLFKGTDTEPARQLVEQEVVSPNSDDALIRDPKSEDLPVGNEGENVASIDDATKENDLEIPISEKEDFRKNNTSQTVAAVTNKEQPGVVERSITTEEIVAPTNGKEVKETVAITNANVKKLNNETTPKTEDDLFVDRKVDAVVAAVQEDNTITVEEIDALLADAQRDIATNRILNSKDRKVDATALLEDVETEMERSFRDKVFEALGDGYEKVRTAVAERNN